MARAPSILRTAHGAGKDTVLRAEATVLDEIEPLNAGHTATGNAARSRRGKPFAPGNSAGAMKGSSLTRVTENPTAPAEQRKIDRKAQTLAAARVREMTVAHGGVKLSSAVRTEVVAWARACAWSDHHYRHGDAKQAARFAELASAHQLRAVGLAQREGAARPPSGGEAPHERRLREILEEAESMTGEDDSTKGAAT